jgi:hypothetical protein
MNLQQNVADCNLQHLNNTILFNLDESSQGSTNIELPFFDILGREVKTTISIGNILIFGQSIEQNQDLALQVQKGFAKANHVAKLVTVSQFLAIDDHEHHINNMPNIIMCDDMDISLKQLKLLVDSSETQIIFKIPSIDWRHDVFSEIDQHFKIPELLTTFNIKSSIHIGLIASLFEKEFCVFNGRSMLKRMMD